ncbi:MAG: WecB/TagA/CpsF family glycosyltransferase [Oscillospiraceae bacterium]|jgi:N-acetylglucosaminyldiphosphoundecaprenol N-acetyl-beta-D-mannosaminyltransferase|nr:WecB/TagA/CpsF family glycosyltransferase [Oscillospiraceae bacterium]
MRTDVLGVGFDNITVAEAAERAAGMMAGGGRGYVVTPNPEIIWMCRRDDALKRAIDGAALVLPDGVGVTLGACILGRPLSGRVPGIDFAEALLAQTAASGGRVFLFGAKPGVAEAAAGKLTERYPGLTVAGVSDGYFSDDSAIIDKINAASPDLLFVCLGAPKQELWLAERADRVNAALCVGLGGALDVFAGTVRRAPALWSRLGIEWLYRLIREPRRILRMSRLPLYLLAVIWSRLRGGNGN